MLFRLAILWQCFVITIGVASADEEASSILADFPTAHGAFVIPIDDHLRQMDDFSFSIDVNFASFRSGNFFFLNDGWDQDGFYFQFDVDHLVLGFGDRGTASYVISPSGLFERGVWYRLSGVKDGDIARLFVDGQEVSMANVAAEIVDSSADLMIGSGDYSPDVAIREFTLWRAPLTGDQIASYGAGEGLRGLPDPVIRYLPDQLENGRIENGVSTAYPATFELFERQEIDEGSAGEQGDRRWAAGGGISLDGSATPSGPDREESMPTAEALIVAEATGLRGAMLIVLAITPIAVYGCGLAVSGHRRWSFGSFPLGLRLIGLFVLAAALAAVALRVIQGPPSPDVPNAASAGSWIGHLESGVFTASHLLLLISTALCFKRLGGDRRSVIGIFSRRSTFEHRAFGMLLLALAVSAVCWLGLGLAAWMSGTPLTVWLQAATALYLAGLAIALIFAVRGDRPLLSLSDDGEEGEGSERWQLPEADVQRITAKLERALGAEDLHRNPNLTLRQLSDAVGVSEHRVSEVLNRHLDTNFYDFINGRRIAEAKRMLLQDRERTVLDIALEVGFNSKSTFYTAFKKVTDQSPAAFRRAMPEDPQDGNEPGDGLADRSVA